ncbi:Asp-tRNA(Asn)/Glu-tRNA(Gln) amidotransferase subunit GatA [Lactobacillus acetotolerans]|jgi:aspartyl-tRNA(Asn)/glutamyl-tRNA(Gln) amidotransferase subunit A|uniref:Glutamyl-tRNA(Gln) amidotransferase subunit A n=2 Tax=Lactobacillus acetotolerans TaxID=1600 RepID=A0A0D6A5K3_9LACO|nr:Asp-tRNA(Asn)/Glu-tRNA(Gln) amidotransferase subunit GatA [Lactobacillus acetotolerans]KRN41668.1 aspartyl glutamyl-tRNA amidotransferase subunit A [Lactobacillus acetotolerans DSM 20749 = JCM 3825]MBN7276294.1 Asp-tRNA(Asn)/Glu-tRNA(Gln) amidotransferase subunit GatA [Lactobacillus acetotolerans]QFG51668.1 Asp-tRNA(Asn)/Glu-tRNA(Gln) amidotransferase subunit GatA [Lactobacillus acetotolerans]QJD73139.1 Asp-tRNA(Asn)/Glu-tRNA(Gln) amidotransferase subunit GatA [Lactobacillus acetotolerans]B
MNYLNENIDSLNKKLANGSLSADKLTKDTVANIKDENKKLNAWITVADDAKPAENLDFSKNKLAGIPIGIKDNITTKGVKTTAASHMLYNYVPVFDATVISKLKKAQATFVGKTNMDEFAMGSSTEHSYYGPTHNPWNLDKVPGGSSGGSAAAVASGQVVAALGSDTGGSIRQPAAFNGIFGIKPTYGRVSRWGLIAFSSSLDQIGVLTKRAKDSAEILNVIAGSDDRDSTVSEKEVPDFTSFIGQGVKGLRIGVPKEYMSDAVDEKVRAAVQKQIDFLKANGAIINKVSLPLTKYVVPTYYIIASSEASSNLQRYDGIRYGYRAKDTKSLVDVYVKSRSEGFGPEVKRRIMLGSFALSAGSYDKFFKQAAKVRTLICNEFDKIFADNDIIVGPTTTTPAFDIGSEISDPIKMYNNDILTISANLAGIPAASVPAGLADGMPVGFQIMAKRFDEGNIFRVADFIERNNKFYEKTPSGMED